MSVDVQSIINHGKVVTAQICLFAMQFNASDNRINRTCPMFHNVCKQAIEMQYAVQRHVFWGEAP